MIEMMIAVAGGILLAVWVMRVAVPWWKELRARRRSRKAQRAAEREAWRAHVDQEAAVGAEDLTPYRFGSGAKAWAFYAAVLAIAGLMRKYGL